MSGQCAHQSSRVSLITESWCDRRVSNVGVAKHRNWSTKPAGNHEADIHMHRARTSKQGSKQTRGERFTGVSLLEV
jgi:hypothetical protein